MGSGTSPAEETIVSERAWVRALMWMGLPLAGAAVGWLLKSVAGWVTSLPWAPLQGPFQLAEQIITSFGEPQATVGAIVLGAVAGLALAFIAEQENLTVTVARDRTHLKRGDYSEEVPRSSISAVFLDGDQLVMLGHDTGELARERSGLDTEKLRSTFVVHGYPWLPEGDPHRNEFRLWVEDTPDLTPAANALLKARARMLGKDDGKQDAALLREEIARLGVVVREEKKRQYWRVLHRGEIDE